MDHIDESTCVIRNPDLPTGEVDGELVALDLERGHCFGMDQVGSSIWAMAETPVTVGAIVDGLISTHEVERSQCLADVVPFVRDLVAEGLLRRFSQ